MIVVTNTRGFTPPAPGAAPTKHGARETTVAPLVMSGDASSAVAAGNFPIALALLPGEHDEPVCESGFSSLVGHVRR